MPPSAQSRGQSARWSRLGAAGLPVAAVLALTTAACSAGSDSSDTDRATAASPTSPAAAASASATASGEPSPSATEAPRGPVLPGLIAFRRYSVGSESDGTLFASASDGSHERRLVEGAAGDSLEDPAWGPDGGLLFSRIGNIGSNHEVHQLVSKPSHGSPVSLSPGKSAHGINIPGFDGPGAYSPDGSLIAYSHASGSSSSTANTSTPSPRPPEAESSPDWGEVR